jgi:hypothetical protein
VHDDDAARHAVFHAREGETRDAEIHRRNPRAVGGVSGHQPRVNTAAERTREREERHGKSTRTHPRGRV